MAQPNVNTVTNKYKFGRGNLLFNPLVAGVYQGFRMLGNCPEFGISVETEKYEHYNSQGGLRQKDLDIVTQIDRTAQIVCDNMDNANIALFISGEQLTVNQAATPVTNEPINVIGGRTYQLGALANNPAGVRGVSSVVVTVFHSGAIAISTPYTAGTVRTNGTHVYLATTSGTTAGSAPAYPTDGTTVVDGGVTWKDLGLITPANAANADYLLDAALGLVSIVSGGAIAAAAALVNAAGGAYRIEVDYTPTANSRDQIRTTGTSELRGQLKFIADNPYGENQDVFCPDVTLAPSGELPLITEDEIAQMTIDVGINQLNSTTSAIYVDGRPLAA